MGMEDLGEDVQTLAQQCNGTAASGAGKQTPETGSGQNKTAVISSTPQKGGDRGVPSLDESPVLVNQRFLTTFNPNKDEITLVCELLLMLMHHDSVFQDEKPKSPFVAVQTLEDTQAVRAVAFHPSGTLYAIGSNSKTLRVCTYPQSLKTRCVLLSI